MDEQSPGLVGWFKAHSTIIFIVVVGLVAGVAFLKRNPSSGGTATPSSIDTTGLQRDANGVPIIYRDVADTFINISVNPSEVHPVSSAPPTNHGGEHPIEPTPSSSGGTTSGNTSTSTNSIGGTYGILGANAKVDFTKFTYNGGLPIPAPKGSRLVQGSFDRVWIIYTPNATTQDLLTSGSGPKSKYLTYPIGAPFIPA